MARSKAQTRKHARQPNTIAKRYKVRVEVIEALEGLAGQHGSIGRAIQIGTELLAQRSKPLKLKPHETLITGQTYKLTPRTVAIIEKLSVQYGTRGNVLAACAQLLRSME